jgi:hypothetical protein
MSTITRTHSEVEYESPKLSKGRVRDRGSGVLTFFKTFFRRKGKISGMLLSKEHFAQFKAALSAPRKSRPGLKKLLSEPSVFE